MSASGGSVLNFTVPTVRGATRGCGSSLTAATVS
jgi:hypothetical protein